LLSLPVEEHEGHVVPLDPLAHDSRLIKRLVRRHNVTKPQQRHAQLSRNHVQLIIVNTTRPHRIVVRYEELPLE